jgi:IS5 family transposase
MRPKLPSEPKTDDLFRSRLDAILDARHELVRLSKLIDWARFDQAFGELYAAQKGRPALPTRLMVGLHLLQHAKGLSDDAVCAAWLENPYYQFFCGEAFFQHQLPLDRSSMSRWRGRIGQDKLELLLAETLAAATRAKAVDPAKFERVTIDTTAQTKAVAHPTDSGLFLRAVEWLNRFAKGAGLPLRQSFARLAVRSRREAARLIHTRAHKQALREVRRLRTFTGRLYRDIARKIAQRPDLQDAFRPVAEPILRLLAQKQGDKHKIYALHAPEVECIAKGKARTRFEFGVKASFAVINTRTKRPTPNQGPGDKPRASLVGKPFIFGGQFIVGARACPGLPYDGHTLKHQIAQVERLTGVKVQRAYVDKGYRGHGLKQPEVYVAQTRGLASPTIKRELRRRSAVEPVIGHMKQDGKLDRHWLQGENGDAVNVLLVAAGHNIRLILNWLGIFYAFILALLVSGAEDSDIQYRRSALA